MLVTINSQITFDMAISADSTVTSYIKVSADILVAVSCTVTFNVFVSINRKITFDMTISADSTVTGYIKVSADILVAVSSTVTFNVFVSVNSQITINGCACINSNSTIRIVDYMVNLACRTQNGIHNGIRVGTSNLIISSIGLIAARFPITTASFTVTTARHPDIRILNIILVCDIITCSKSVITISNMNIINIVASSVIFKITVKLYPEILRAVNVTIRKSVACSTGDIVFAGT